jgi:hypothetical protein
VDESEKVKAQCQTCRKSFGGTFEKLNATAACPKCGASGDWWRPIETRMIHRQRLIAGKKGGQWTPPPTPYGHSWVPREQAPTSYLVLRLAAIGMVLSPIGLITGPIGIFVAIADRERAAQGNPRQDVGTGLGIGLCLLAIVLSLYGCYVLWAVFVDGQPTSNFR